MIPLKLTLTITNAQAKLQRCERGKKRERTQMLPILGGLCRCNLRWHWLYSERKEYLKNSRKILYENPKE